MNTSWAKRNLAAYVDGELGPVANWVMRQHLHLSPSCIDDYEERESEESLSALMRHLSAGYSLPRIWARASGWRCRASLRRVSGPAGVSIWTT